MADTPLDTILPEKCDFLSLVLAVLCEVLAGSLADGVLADAILIPLHPPIPPTNTRKVRGLRKKYRK